MHTGKPLIDTLTKNILKGADAKLHQLFYTLKASDDRSPTIEGLITYLVRYPDILDSITSADGHNLSVDEIDNWLTVIKTTVVTEVADDWKSGSYYERFLQRLRGPRDRNPVTFLV